MNATTYATRLVTAQSESKRRHPFSKRNQRRFVEKRMGFIGSQTLHERSLEADTAMHRIITAKDQITLRGLGAKAMKSMRRFVLLIPK